MPAFAEHRGSETATATIQQDPITPYRQPVDESEKSGRKNKLPRSKAG
ncbi:hypothetical protein [Nitrosospira sp. Nsp13]|nr:hypothetical protein [Nitrosospira sp. Nsp13]